MNTMKTTFNQFGAAAALYLSVSLPAWAQGTQEVPFDWTATMETVTPVMEVFKASRSGQPPVVSPRYIPASKETKAAPALMLIVGAFAADVLANTIIKVTRERKAGTFIVVCNGKATMQTGDSFPSGLVIVHDCASGKTQSFTEKDLSSDPGILKAVLPSAKK